MPDVASEVMPSKQWLPPCVQQLSKDARRAAMFRSRMEAVDKWMVDRGLPKKMRYQISKYYAEVSPH